MIPYSVHKLMRYSDRVIVAVGTKRAIMRILKTYPKGAVTLVNAPGLGLGDVMPSATK